MTWVCEDPDVIELVHWAKEALRIVLNSGDGEVAFRLEAAIGDISIPEEEE